MLFPPFERAKHGRLYINRLTDGGFTCLGFDVARRQTQAVADWLKRPELAPPARMGTRKAWAAWQAAMAAGAAHNRATGERATFELTPQFIGLEGKRVEVTSPDGGKTRFTIGKSTGWAPCHLEILTSRSSGGSGVYFPEGATFRVIGA